MLGLEPQKRDRTNLKKVSKSKSRKESKSSPTKKQDSTGPLEASFCSEGNAALPGKREVPPLSGSPAPELQLKVEGSLPPERKAGSSMRFESPDNMPLASIQAVRLLTPSSDADFLTSGSPYAISPSSDLLSNDNSVAFDHGAHDNSNWDLEAGTYPSYADFDFNALQLDLYGGSSGQQNQGCVQGHEHARSDDARHPQPLTPDQLSIHDATMDGHEDWECQIFQ
jgi:hypothetical protein